MSEPRHFEGRPTAGIGMNIGYGSILFIGGLLLLLMDPAGVAKNSALICIDAFMIGFGLLLFALLVNGLRPRRLVIDDWGIHFIIGKREKWRVLWGELRAIGTDSLSGNYPRVGFYLRSERKAYSLNVRDTLGPKELLQEAYKEIILRTANSNVSVEDYLGWGQELNLPVRTASVQTALRQQIVDGKWYECEEQFFVRYFEIVVVIAFMIGAVLLGLGYLLLNADSNFIFWGVESVGIGVLMAVIALAVYRDTPVAVQVNLENIGLRFPFKRMIEVPWGDMAKCSYVPTREFLVIWRDVPKRTLWNAKVPAEVGAAIMQRFASAHSSHVVKLP